MALPHQLENPAAQLGQTGAATRAEQSCPVEGGIDAQGVVMVQSKVRLARHGRVERLRML
jgi:hypothetical protein